MAYGVTPGYAREQQIQQLLQDRPECTPRSADRSVFDFGLNVKRGARTDLVVVRILLPPQFPSAPPQIAVTTAGVRHPWIDAAGNVTGCPSLYSWNGTSRLSHVVGDIVSQFVASPPLVGGAQGTPPLPPPASGSYGGSPLPPPTSSGYGGSFYPGSASDAQQRRSSSSSSSSASHGGSGGSGGRPGTLRREDSDPDGVLLPPIPDTFPELEALGEQALQELQDNPEALEQFFAGLPMPNMTREMREQIVASSRKQAAANLSFREHLEKLQAEVAALQRAARERWDALKQLEQRQSVAMRKYDPLRLLTRLEASCGKLEDEGELLASEFLAGEVPLSDFVKREMELRKLYHLRKAKAERFRFQLKQQG